MVDVELFNRLVSMPRRDYSSLIYEVDAKRRAAVELEEQNNPPRPDMTAYEFACWLARQHYAIDKGVTRIIYAPGNAPANEVRLLEVNVLGRLPELAPLEAFDCNPEIDGVDFSVYVADVSPGQFEKLKRGEIAPPEGWSLKDSVEIPMRE